MAEVQHKAKGLESSLTSMDWLHTMNVPPGFSGNKSSTGKELNNNTEGHRKGSVSGSDDESSQESPRYNSVNNSNGQKPGKPPHSYASLIARAVDSSPRKMMTLSEIYQWIMDNYPYFKDAGNGWKVAIPTSYNYFSCLLLNAMKSFKSFKSMLIRSNGHSIS